MNIPSRTINAFAFCVILAVSVSSAEGETATNAQNGGNSKVIAVSPVLEIKLSGKANAKPAVSPVQPSQPTVTMPAKPNVLSLWKDNRGGKWMGGDGSSDNNSFFKSGNWAAPDSPRAHGEGYDLSLSGSSALARVGQALGLLQSSSLTINDGASLGLNKNIIQYSGNAAIIVDAAYVEGLGGLKPLDNNSSLDLIVTHNAMINSDAAANSRFDFAGGSLLVTDSTCSFSGILRGKVSISGYGSVEVGSNSKQAIEGTSIDLTSPRAKFRFIGKSVDKVISEDLDKFSVSGALPIYGSNPAAEENGDNILIRDDGGTGTILSVVK